jgi:hypothetical protein
VSTAKSGVSSQAPKVKIEPVKDMPVDQTLADQLLKMLPRYTEEQKKYHKCWALDEYRIVAPGENLVDLFMATSGRASKKFLEAGLDVTAVDFAFNCLDKDVKELAQDNDDFRFIEHDLNEHIDLPSEFGFCTDVMEHIPEEEIDAVLENILGNSRHIFFQIATTNDIFGEHPDIEEDLHVSVHDYFWWLEKFASKKAIIHRSNEFEGHCLFYVTGFPTEGLKWPKVEINTSNEQVIKNMEANAKLGFQKLMVHPAQDTEIMLVAGGPSLNEFEGEIRESRLNGMPIITANGSYNWCLSRGIKPSLQCVIDARDLEGNRRFTNLVDGLTDETKFLIASQCDPKITSHLPPERTYLWHVSLSDELLPDMKRIFGKMYEDWAPCPGGSTVVLRALCALQMLGYRKINMYGFDSCLMDDEHHAYEQKQNEKDLETVMEIIVGGGTKFAKTFKCTPWHAYQAKDFEQMVPRVLGEMQLNIKGDGMIAHLVNAGAKMAELEET